MKHLIEPYLKYHETAWAKSTMKTARSILKKCEDCLESPEGLFDKLRERQIRAYTLKATFTRICHLEKWAQREPIFKAFTNRHRATFKHAYVKKEVGISYEEALAAITQLDSPAREHAYSLLNTGLRISESYDVGADQMVRGKGGKVRKVYGRVEYTIPKTTLWRKLRDVGLKPHDLRKLFATRLVERGASAADLCKVMGWSSIATAYQYLQSRDEGRLESLVASCKEER